MSIKDIKLLSKALLAKWKWRLGKEKQGLQKDILESKYGSWRVLIIEKSNQYMSTWLKDLKGDLQRRGEKRWFDQNIEWKVGPSSIIKFWEDTWLGLDSLTLRFPRLYENPILKNKVIKEFEK